MDVYGEAAPSNLAAHKITHVLTLSLSPIPEEKKVHGVKYKYLQMADRHNQDIIGTDIVRKAINVISEAIEDGGNILVHSETGLSRAPAIAASYLMYKFQWTNEKAITFVRMKRPNIAINCGFVDQLAIFVRMIHNFDFRDVDCSNEYNLWKSKTVTNPKGQMTSLCGQKGKDRKTWDSKESKRSDIPSVVISDSHLS